MSFTIGSLFDGSGGFPLAATMCGGTPKWASEVEPYPIAVTKSRFPGVKHLGSVTDIKGGEVEPVDVITFGSPCQDLSVAGKRAGLKHEANGDDETTRSGLFMEAVRIIKEMREATNGVYPRFALWENVPGAFSSNKGEDFRIVLEELIKVAEPTAVMPEVPKNGWPYADSYCGDGWSIAYRVLDAQFWGVPQRRRRIYLVADFRGECAGKVSFEREGLRGYFETSRTPWQAAPGDAESGSGTADCEGADGVKAYGWPLGFRPENTRVYEETATTICNGTRPGFTTGVIQPIAFQGWAGAGASLCIGQDVAASLVVKKEQMVAYSLDPLSSNSMKSSNPHSGCRQTEIARTLDTFDPNPCKNQGGIAIVEAVGFDGYNSTDTGDKAATLGVNCGMSTGRNGVIEPVPYTLKIRSGCDVDAKGKAAGKSALIQTNKAATLATVHDQYLFQPVIDCHILDDQGGSQISVRDDGKCPTLRAETHGNLPCVLSVENHPADSRVNIDDSGKVQTLTSRMGTGGGNVPMVMEPLVYESHPMDSRIKELDGVSPTVSAKWHKGAADTPLVCEPVAQLASGKDESGCLMASGYDKLGAQEMFSGDYTVIEKRPIPIHDQATRFAGKHGEKSDGKGNGLGVGNPGDPMNTLTGGDRHAVCYTLSHGGFMVNPSDDNLADTLQATDYKDSQVIAYGVDSRNATEYPEMTGALQADAAHNLNSNNVVRVSYIVRRLTPTECARLQGFPDNWGHPNVKAELTDDEYQFWLNVRNTHAAINDKPTKEYTKDQILKWYNSLHTDSSEYKMWGNGIALPNALYMMQGIADVMSEEKAARKKWLDELLK